jgi:predicted PurR-regulated permease PerM
MNESDYQSILPIKVSWRSLTAWSVVIFLLWILRHFFFIIFLTFIVSYSMRGLVVFLRERLFPRGSSRFLELALAVACFLSLLAALYGVGAYLVPEFVSQGQALVRRLTSPGKSPRQVFDELLRDSVGRWLFQQQYGQRTTPRYQTAYHAFISEERQIEEIRKAITLFEQAFASKIATGEKGELSIEAVPLPEQLREFETWVEQVKAAEVLKQNGDSYSDEWQRFYRREAARLPGLTPLSRLTEQQRSDALRQFVAAGLLEDASKREDLYAEWRNAQLTAYLDILVNQYPDKIKVIEQRYYEEHSASYEVLPDSYASFVSLRKALKSGASGEAIVIELVPQQVQSSENSYIEFEKTERMKLVTEWKRGELAARLQEFLEKTVVSSVTRFGTYLGEAIPRILLLPFQLSLVLLLSFLITIDVPRLRAGVQRLKQSRVSEIYNEVAPGIVSFGKLIGRAFQAQAVIALVNSALTLVAIKFLGIQNEVFLCTVVFLCSFVPVLGVVFSSVPIAVMALIQDDGGLLVAVWAIVAILIIHFIETSLLNPKIVGNMLHLDPVLVLTILAVSEHFFGVWGLLLGVPVMVYVIRVVILNEEVPGFFEPRREVL